jgi:hypothetical protein
MGIVRSRVQMSVLVVILDQLTLTRNLESLRVLSNHQVYIQTCDNQYLSRAVFYVVETTILTSLNMILSIDMGINNLAICGRVANKLVYLELINIYEDNKVVPTKKKDTIEAVVRLLVATLKRRFDLFSDASELRIEQQPCMRLNNIKMKVLSHVIQAFVVSHFNSVSVKFVSPKKKTNKLLIKHSTSVAHIKSKYARTKRVSVLEVYRLFDEGTLIADHDIRLYLDNRIKKDDMCDAILQSL